MSFSCVTHYGDGKTILRVLPIHYHFEAALSIILKNKQEQYTRMCQENFKPHTESIMEFHYELAIFSRVVYCYNHVSGLSRRYT